MATLNDLNILSMVIILKILQLYNCCGMHVCYKVFEKMATLNDLKVKLSPMIVIWYTLQVLGNCRML